MAQRFGARLGVAEGFDGLVHMLGIVGDCVHYGHGLGAARHGRDGCTTVRVLLHIPLSEGFDVATFAGAQHHRGRAVLDWLCGVVRVVVAHVARRRYGNGQRPIVVTDDLHVRPVPRTAEGYAWARRLCQLASPRGAVW